MFGLHCAKDFADFGARGKAELIDEVFSGEQWSGNERFVSKLLLLQMEEVVVVPKAITAVAINAMQLDFHVEAIGRHETFKLCCAHFLHVHELHVAGDHE